MEMPRPLPAEVQQLCETLQVPPRLVAHLRLVHDVAAGLVEGLHRTFPSLAFDADAVLFGAAVHDLGKVRHPNELAGPGSRHEQDGPTVLERAGVPPSLSRFAGTHGEWHGGLPLEDLLVALADAVWKGRLPELEGFVAKKIATMLAVEEWEVFAEIDKLADQIAAEGQERLAWQQYPTPD
jgi:hypothetical protein